MTIEGAVLLFAAFVVGCLALGVLFAMLVSGVEKAIRRMYRS